MCLPYPPSPHSAALSYGPCSNNTWGNWPAITTTARTKPGPTPTPYFTGPDRSALFLEAEGQTAGFALINRVSVLGEKPDHAMAEFYVLPERRGKGLGLEAAGAILRRRPGSWEVKYHRDDGAAARLWRETAEPYAPQITPLDEEQVLSFLVTEEVYL